MSSDGRGEGSSAPESVRLLGLVLLLVALGVAFWWVTFGPPAAPDRPPAAPDRVQPAPDRPLPAPSEGEPEPAPAASPPLAREGVVGERDAPGPVREAEAPPPKDVREIYRVGGEVTPPVVVSRVAPEYTETARRARVNGIVILEAVIDRQGNVVDTRVLKGLPMGLDRAATDAVSQWKFRPATRHGEPVDVYFILTVNFRVE